MYVYIYVCLPSLDGLFNSWIFQQKNGLNQQRIARRPPSRPAPSTVRCSGARARESPTPATKCHRWGVKPSPPTLELSHFHEWFIVIMGYKYGYNG